MHVTPLSTLVLRSLFTVIIKARPYYFTELVSMGDLRKSTSHAEISTPNSSFFKAVKGDPLGPTVLQQPLLFTLRTS